MRRAQPDEGRLQRAGVDRRRRVQHQAAARRRRRHHARSTSRRWCRCGCSPTRSRAATRSSSSRARRTRRRACSSPNCSSRPGCRTDASTSSTATRSRSTRSCTIPTSRPSASSAPRRSRSTSTRPAPPTASGCRRSVGPRTTCSCCPTPISTWPPTPSSARRTARPASAAWRISVVLAVDTIADALVDKIKERIPAIQVGPASEEGNEMGPLITGEHRDKVAGYVAGAEAEGATLVVDGRDGAPGGRLLPQAEPDRQRQAGDEGVRRRDLRAGAHASPACTATTRASS